MKLQAKYRDGLGKGPTGRLKRQGQVPGIVYGKENIPVYMREDVTNRLIDSLGGATKLIDLAIEKDGKSEVRKVIVQEYHKMYYKNKMEHVDFREVDESTVLEVDVPIKTVGTSNAIKLGGVLQIIRHEVPVRCQVKHIPELIEIDISNLNFGESIHVLDIPYPTGVKPVVSGRNFTLMTLPGSGNKDSADEDAPVAVAATPAPAAGDKKAPAAGDKKAPAAGDKKAPATKK